MIVSTDAIVLRSMKYGDTSKIVTLYSRKFGKIKVIAKGARGTKSKFGASLEPMTHSSITLYKKEHRDLHLLSGCEIVSPFLKLSDDGEKMAVGLAMIELVHMVMHEEEENQPMYALLLESLRALECSTRHPVNIFFAFELRLAEVFGYGLDVRKCSRCGRKMIDEETGPSAFVLLANGSAACAECQKRFSVGGVKISKGLLRTLNFLNSAPLRSVCDVSLTPSMEGETLSLLQMYLKYHIEGVRTLKSLSLFTRV